MGTRQELTFLIFWSLVVGRFVMAGMLIYGYNDSSYQISCMGSRLVNSQHQLCGFVTWSAAQVFPVNANFSVYNPHSPLTDDEQASFSAVVFQNIKNLIPGRISSSCELAIERLSCVTAYPECAMAGNTLSSISYFQPCKLHCEQVNTFCSSKLHCNNYPDVSCLAYVPTGYFLLDPGAGPFKPLPVIYGIALACWLIFGVIWNYLVFVKYRASCVLFCRAVSGIPIIKSVVLTFGLAFWGTCNSWKMCSFWIGVSVVNIQLVYETAQMIVFVLIAKGWTIMRSAFTPNEWRTFIIVMSAFYMVNSIILVLQNTVLSVQGFWIANTVLYGTMYAYIYINVSYQLAALRQQVNMLTPEMPSDICAPLKMKYRMYIGFLFMVLLSAAMEVTAHGLLFNEGKYWIVLLTYEISNVVIFGIIGYIFQPQEYSPFFFMVPARVNDERTRPIPIVEASEDATGGPEVDLAPLLNHPLGLANAPGKMILVKNADRAVILGLEVQDGLDLADIDADTEAGLEELNALNGGGGGGGGGGLGEGRPNIIAGHGLGRRAAFEMDAPRHNPGPGPGPAAANNNVGALGLFGLGHARPNGAVQVNQEDDGLPAEHNEFLVRRRFFFF